MRARSFLTFLMAFPLPAVISAQGAGAAKAKRAEQTAESRLFIMPSGDVKWADLGPGAPGVKVADLWGNHAKRAFGALFKLPAGFAAPLHTHTYDMRVLILSGTYIQAPEGKPEFRLGPGSYFLQPGGNYRHTTSCDTTSECVFFVESKGPFDLKPVQPAKEPAKD
jgi:quercetin dioxygenase-like cupin family protein